MGNPFVHIELAAGDVGSAKKFYKSLFDWKLDDVPMGGMVYTTVGVGKGTGGGMMQKHMPEQPTAWTPYVEVASVDATLKKAKSAGGQVAVERTEIGGGMGAFGIVVDPQGAIFGVWETAKKAPAPKTPKKAARKKAAPKKAAPKKAAKSKKKGRR